MGADIRFPHLGIEISDLGRSISIGDFSIKYYGMIIAFGMVCGYLVASYQAKRTGQNSELYLDLTLWDIVFAVIGARIYYVIFSWEDYKDNIIQIFNIRGGGLAIYGGVIAGVITTFVFAKVKKQSFWKLVDTACAGLLIGQVIGRWGNFFNREAFGDYTDNFLAMQIRESDVYTGYITDNIANNIAVVDGIRYIQVHPTFLYESLWNLCLLIIILLYTKHKKFDGELFAIYVFGYGLGRVWIEGLRTDQLIFFNTGLAVSQVLSGILVILSGAVLIYNKIQNTKTEKK